MIRMQACNGLYFTNFARKKECCKKFYSLPQLSYLRSLYDNRQKIVLFFILNSYFPQCRGMDAE